MRKLILEVPRRLPSVMTYVANVEHETSNQSADPLRVAKNAASTFFSGGLRASSHDIRPLLCQLAVPTPISSRLTTARARKNGPIIAVPSTRPYSYKNVTRVDTTYMVEIPFTTESWSRTAGSSFHLRSMLNYARYVAKNYEERTRNKLSLYSSSFRHTQERQNYGALVNSATFSLVELPPRTRTVKIPRMHACALNALAAPECLSNHKKRRRHGLFSCEDREKGVNNSRTREQKEETLSQLSLSVTPRPATTRTAAKRLRRNIFSNGCLSGDRESGVDRQKIAWGGLSLSKGRMNWNE